jgi:hypothetical protein
MESTFWVPLTVIAYVPSDPAKVALFPAPGQA